MGEWIMLANANVPLLFFGGVVAFVLIWIVVTYNGLVRLRLHCKESWSDIDTELRRRYDLIPNLVETVKGYAAHERQVLQAVVEARTKAAGSHGSPGEQAADENMLVGALQQLWAVSEGYPDLKANENFLQLQNELSNTEDRIQAARRFFNANVRDLNTRISIFPSSVIAGLFKFQPGEFFEVDPAARAVPNAKV
jgi:LemA protein